ncbi:MAG: amino acid dehydrogenase, partial [Pseudomonadota bacterium]
ALEDVTRLAKGMTYKNALGGIPFGGGKAVIIGDPHTDKTPELFRVYGRAIEMFGGLYYTAEDSGVSEEDLAYTAEETRFVAGVAGKGRGGNPSPFTARGCFIGIKAAVQHKLKTGSLDGLSVCVLGIGAVGMALARHLHEAGARLIVSDVNRSAIDTAVAELGATAIDVDKAHTAGVDIFSPCALGGSINHDTLPDLKATIIAGAANNQLKTPDMDLALKERGILYAPDYVINAAGVISVGLEILEDWSEDAMIARIDRIGVSLTSIFDRAAAEKRPTGEIADQMAREVISNAKR